MLEAINIALNGGLGGLASAYVKEHRIKTTVQPKQTNKLRLSMKFGPLIQSVEERFFRTLDTRTNNPQTIEDTLYKDQVGSFFTLLATCQEIVASKSKDHTNCSVWLIYDGDVLISPYFRLEIRSKDGKRLIVMAEAHGIL